MLFIEPKEKKMNLKEKFEDYTEQELIELMNKIWQADVNSEEEHDTLCQRHGTSSGD